jgi:hypothetical protein
VYDILAVQLVLLFLLFLLLLLPLVFYRPGLDYLEQSLDIVLEKRSRRVYHPYYP